MIHRLPALPYEVVALEPHIDTGTMLLHHGQHHAGYVDALNATVEEYPELREHSAAWLLLNLGKVPEAARASLRVSAGGHINHSLFWRAMTPKSEFAPSGKLGDAVARDFGSFEAFKAAFELAGMRIIGSGWVWLVRAQQNGGRLRVLTTGAHANPMMEGHFPILMNDVWEHAYYLKHHNRRADYLRNWWDVVSWEEAARRFSRSDHDARDQWATTGDLLLEAA